MGAYVFVRTRAFAGTCVAVRGVCAYSSSINAQFAIVGSTVLTLAHLPLIRPLYLWPFYL
jgi:hypothetical protein